MRNEACCSVSSGFRFESLAAAATFLYDAPRPAPESPARLASAARRFDPADMAACATVCRKAPGRLVTSVALPSSPCSDGRYAPVSQQEADYELRDTVRKMKRTCAGYLHTFHAQPLVLRNDLWRSKPAFGQSPKSKRKRSTEFYPRQLCTHTCTKFRKLARVMPVTRPRAMHRKPLPARIPASCVGPIKSCTIRASTSRACARSLQDAHRPPPLRFIMPRRAHACLGRDDAGRKHTAR
jgi:hypothetical protein